MRSGSGADELWSCITPLNGSPLLSHARLLNQYKATKLYWFIQTLFAPLSSI